MVSKKEAPARKGVKKETVEEKRVKTISDIFSKTDKFISEEFDIDFKKEVAAILPPHWTGIKFFFSSI